MSLSDLAALGSVFSGVARFMDRLMAETPVARNDDALAQWRADIVAERSSDVA
jgi:hypothetical protein